MLATSHGAQTKPPEDAAQSVADAAEASEGRVTSADAEDIYKILVAEFAGRRGQLPLALSNYLELARSTGNPELAERAVRVAVYARA